MRDPERIPLVIEALRAYWLQNPDLRLCQIIGNLVEDITPRAVWNQPRMDSTAYNIEDDRVLEVLLGAVTKHQ